MSSWENNGLKLSIFGESHGEAIGVVLDGLPAGEPLNLAELAAFAARRAPGKASTSTKRQEADIPHLVSGFYNGKITGAPLCAIIANTDTHSQDYNDEASIARPGHADYTAWLRYGGANDVRGGGHFSGRLTAPLVLAGGIAKQLLRTRGVEVGAHIFSIGSLCDTPFPETDIPLQILLDICKKTFPVQNDEIGKAMIAQVEAAAACGDSLGGIVECYAMNLPAGLGSPMFDRVEQVLSTLLFAIPAVKGLEFGAGFAAAKSTGSQNNDAFRMIDGRVRTTTNHHGGILGGITSGMPLLLRVACKPTPSISQPQQSINFKTGENCELCVKGRHDPCIVPRAVPCVEAATALGLLSLML